MRTCKKCGEEKPDLDFICKESRTGRDYFRSICFPCARKKLTHEQLSNSQRLTEYGLDHLHYMMLQSAQDNCCAICKISFSLTQDCVDHNHKTQQVRGLLCRPCNAALGIFKDDPKVLQIAIDYLRKGNTLCS